MKKKATVQKNCDNLSHWICTVFSTDHSAFFLADRAKALAHCDRSPASTLTVGLAHPWEIPREQTNLNNGPAIGDNATLVFAERHHHGQQLFQIFGLHSLNIRPARCQQSHLLRSGPTTTDHNTISDRTHNRNHP